MIVFVIDTRSDRCATCGNSLSDGVTSIHCRACVSTGQAEVVMGIHPGYDVAYASGGDDDGDSERNAGGNSNSAERWG